MAMEVQGFHYSNIFASPLPRSLFLNSATLSSVFGSTFPKSGKHINPGNIRYF